MGLFNRSVSPDRSNVSRAEARDIERTSGGYNGVPAAGTTERRGLFSSRREPEPVVTEPRRSSGLFSSSRTSVDRNGNTVDTSPTRRGNKLGGLIGRNREDPSIIAARERVIQAEVAEKEADRALLEAKAASRSAREQTKILEREAAEEARLAKQKQHAARGITKRGKLLGKHDHIAV